MFKKYKYIENASSLKKRRILIIAFQIPPFFGSSGLQRVISFCNEFAEANWQVTVITASQNAYEQVSSHQSQDLDPRVRVRRAFALDSQRHLSIRGRYFRTLALPDRWTTWFVGAFLLSAIEIWRRKPEYILSTYPIATAHSVASALAKLFRIPLIADFRDQMTDVDYPSDPRQYEAHRRIEQRTVKEASLCVFTAPGARSMYLQRYKDLERERTQVIENGYDERYFRSLRASPISLEPLTLLHSGIVYSEHRDPTALFDALGELKLSNELTNFRLILRASGYQEKFGLMLQERGIADIVSLKPPIPYGEAIQEMMSGYVLLIMQGPSCNAQIPAKLYEYIRTGQVIVGLTPANSDTAQVLTLADCRYIADIDSVSAIKTCLSKLLSDARSGELASSRPASNFVTSCSRKQRARTLLGLLEAGI